MSFKRACKSVFGVCRSYSMKLWHSGDHTASHFKKNAKILQHFTLVRHGLLFSHDDLNVKIFADGSEVIMTTARQNYNAHVKIMGTETVEHWLEQKESVTLHRIAT